MPSQPLEGLHGVARFAAEFSRSSPLSFGLFLLTTFVSSLGPQRTLATWPGGSTHRAVFSPSLQSPIGDVGPANRQVRATLEEVNKFSGTKAVPLDVRRVKCSTPGTHPVLGDEHRAQRLQRDSSRLYLGTGTHVRALAAVISK